jgi:hypothetical protein
MKSSWHTAWHGQDIVIYQNDVEVDRLHAASIERVIFVHRDSGNSPNDLVHAIVETNDSHLILPADTGFAGRVNFERHAFWAERACVYWVKEVNAHLKFKRHWWSLGHSHPGFMRLPRHELSATLQNWPLKGPQTWEERKWRRIELSRPFALDPDEQLHA